MSAIGRTGASLAAPSRTTGTGGGGGLDWGGSWAVLSALEAAVGGAGGSVDGWLTIR